MFFKLGREQITGARPKQGAQQEAIGVLQVPYDGGWDGTRTA